MKILTDDPDWAPDLYRARVLAIAFVRAHGHWQQDAMTCLRAACKDLTISYYPKHSPIRLTIDSTDRRVLSIEWKPGDALRMKIEIYCHGRWESRLKAMAHPRPWLQQWRAWTTFSGSSPRRKVGVSRS